MQLSDLMVGLGVLIVVFFLVLLLGLQIQISTLTRRLDEVIHRLKDLNRRQAP